MPASANCDEFGLFPCIQPASSDRTVAELGSRQMARITASGCLLPAQQRTAHRLASATRVLLITSGVRLAILRSQSLAHRATASHQPQPPPVNEAPRPGRRRRASHRLRTAPAALTLAGPRKASLLRAPTSSAASSEKQVQRCRGANPSSAARRPGHSRRRADRGSWPRRCPGAPPRVRYARRGGVRSAGRAAR